MEQKEEVIQEKTTFRKINFSRQEKEDIRRRQEEMNSEGAPTFPKNEEYDEGGESGESTSS